MSEQSGMKKCFVIMPFSQTERHNKDYWNRHFDPYLKSLIEKNQNVKAFRSEPLRGNIANMIISDLVTSDIVVADLTDLNANVLWELGVRQSFKNGTITIAEEETHPPFDFSHKAVLFYHSDHLDNEKFETSFLTALKSCLNNPNEVDSPVLEAMGGRGTLYSIMNKEQNKRRVDALEVDVFINEKVYQEIYDGCLKNIESRKASKQTEMTDKSFKTSPVEFLYINRYLDLDVNFYRDLYMYHTLLISLNNRLRNWEIAPLNQNLNIEKWFLDNKSDFDKGLFKMKEFIDQARKSLSLM